MGGDRLQSILITAYGLLLRGGQPSLELHEIISISNFEINHYFFLSM